MDRIADTIQMEACIKKMESWFFTQSGTEDTLAILIAIGIDIYPLARLFESALKLDQNAIERCEMGLDRSYRADYLDMALMWPTC